MSRQERERPSERDPGSLKLAVSIQIGMKVLGFVILLLVTFGTASKLAVHHAGDHMPNGLLEISTRFDLDGENTLPSWFSSMQLFLAASLLTLIASMVGKRSNHSFGIGLSLPPASFTFLWMRVLYSTKYRWYR